MPGPVHLQVGSGNETFEIIAFRIRDQEFCVRTTTIREIRGWAPSTAVPHSPPDVVGRPRASSR